ncbi:G-protein-signaling modulator 2 isoform X4 [Diorhabda carinulata]|uniref:G-protein-signaling modulator 2 isoform X4 n=1 Tax=Diorhabda carinulata TaxID=1163345 RepID=UPI0025A27254|nr:G-protein-signaling modulator 2 isoform X4 [Diorhabda carinulata]
MSSTSVDNVSGEAQEYDGSGNMCLELALEGERLCKAGDCKAGVAFFQAAIQAGTDDLRTLSAIYSQLGNAYFYLGDYGKAMQYHKHDLTLARTMGDKLGEAKSSGNLGNTLKVMGKFDEAVVCCKRHLELSRELEDKLSEGRALYNLGNVYHAKGKHIGRVGNKDPGDFPEDVKSCLLQAVTYYEENLALMQDLGDVAAQGRACGNLGNTFYLLGDFAQAIHYHEERLSIARQFGDKAAERRAHSNLGNSHIFMGQFEEAAHHYKRTLSLAQELCDPAIEAQACYSLGNTYTLLRNYDAAIEYHLRHLLIAQNLSDRVGEGRACWSLGNAYASLGNHDKALTFAKKHLEISKDLTPDGKRPGLSLPQKTTMKASVGEEDDSFFELLSRFQSKRMDDQRCSLTVDNKENRNTNNIPYNNETPEDLIDMIAGMQSKRMDEQRVSLPHLPGLQSNSRQILSDPHRSNSVNSVPDDNFLDQLVRCQDSRLEDQRSPLPVAAVDAETDPPPPTNSSKSGATVPDEDFFSLIMRFQSGRMDDQRASVPRRETRIANGSVPHPPDNLNNNLRNSSTKKKK